MRPHDLTGSCSACIVLFFLPPPPPAPAPAAAAAAAAVVSVGVKLQIKHATDTGDYAQLGSLAATIADLEQRRAAAEAKAKAAAEV